MTWYEIATDAYKAAQTVKSHPRSCVSRAYYAAFSAVTLALSAKGVRFPDDREGPSHSRLTRLVENNLLSELGQIQTSGVKKTLRRLYQARVDADYLSARTIGKAEATRALQDACYVLTKLKVEVIHE